MWHVPESGSFDIFAAANDRVGVTIDGIRVVAASAGKIRTISLDAGFHSLQIDYRQIRDDSALYVQWAPSGGLARRFDPEILFPAEPSAEQFSTNLRLRILRRSTALAWALFPILLLVRTGRFQWRLLAQRALNRRWQALVGPSILCVAFVVYFADMRSFVPRVSERNDVVFSADGQSAIQALVWGPSAPRATNHPLFLLVRPLARGLQAMSPVPLFRAPMPSWQRLL